MFDQTERLPTELASADAQITRLLDIIEALRASRFWRIMHRVHRLKQRLLGGTTVESVDAWLDEVIAMRPRPGPATRITGRDIATGYPAWLADDEPGLLATLAFADPGNDIAVVVYKGDASEAELGGLSKDFVCLLDARDRLQPLALGIAAAILQANPAIRLIYADADQIDADGHRHSPDFRPDWDPLLPDTSDLGGFVVAHASLFTTPMRTPAGLAAMCAPDEIHHVPAILCHRPSRERSGVPRASHVLPSPAPLVSLIIPTRDQPGLLSACLDGLLNATAYPLLEVILVDNGTTDPQALAVLEAARHDARVRIVTAPGPFNWSRLNNLGVAEARGDVVVLLNNDTATIDPSWLTELVTHALRPEIGAVGAKLLYPDGRVQHAGIYIDDDGGTKHLFRFRQADDPGPFDLLATVHTVTAVTGACLAVERRKYLEAGGPTESLAIASNDVDFCLRLTALGYRNLWTPFAVVEHRELATRGADTTPEMQARAERELRQLRRDWGGALAREPHLNPNLVIQNEELYLRGHDSTKNE